MKPLPMPIRVAAGLVATVLEEAEQLPRRLTELPVTAVSQALQSAMRVQQKVTDLAIKGDRALGALRPVPEAPTWARFDEDEEPAPLPRNGLHDRYDWNERYDPEPPYEPRSPKVTPVRILPDLDPEDDPDAAVGQLDAEATTEATNGAVAEATTEVPAPRVPTGEPENGLVSDRAPGIDQPAEPNGQPSAGATERRHEQPDAATKRRHEQPDAADQPDATKQPDEQPGTTKQPSAATEQPEEQPTEPQPTGPTGLEGYDTWSLPQLRARFRTLKPHQLQALVDWETEHQNRPPYLTMLSNRIASVTGQ